LKKIGLPKEAAIKHSRQTSRNPNARNGVTLDYSPLAKFFLAALSRLDLPGNRRALGIIEGEPLKTFGHQIKHANGITVLPHVQAQSRIAETGETPEERGIAARGLRDSLEALVSVRAFTRKTKGHVILNLPLVDRQKKAAETALTAKKLVERAYGLNGLTAAILTHKNRRTGKVKGYSPYLLIPKEQVPTFLKAIKRHNRHAPFLKRQA
jgi:hypothetical protein